MRFSYYEPASVDEAIATLRGPHGTFKVLAGGTDVLINLRRRAVAYDGLVNIKHIPEMTQWQFNPRSVDCVSEQLSPSASWKPPLKWSTATPPWSRP